MLNFKKKNYRKASRVVTSCYVSLGIEKYDEQKGTSHAVLPVPEPGDINKARAVDLEAERGECKKLQDELRRVHNLSAKIGRTVAAELKEPFSSKMKNFLAKADGQMKVLQESVEECSVQFVKCLNFYKFTPKKGKIEDTKPSDFFDSWYLFCEDFKNLWKKEQQKIEIQLKKEGRMKLKDKSDRLQVDVQVSKNIVLLTCSSIIT